MDLLSEAFQKLVEDLEKHPKVIAAVLFGSCAREEQTPLSDIDIAVFLKDPTPDDEADIGSMYSDSIDLVLFHRLPLYIQFEVLKDGKEVFVKDRQVFNEIVLKTLMNYHEMERFFKELRPR
ncbi:MAG: nucleotidyltransferase domain-containing protein [Thermotogae bacterium]|nr:MAG: nucleotidyltransferase domain-containing protein [Thermotogota bacterium]